jgi:transposase
VFTSTWDNVYRAVAWVVEYGLEHRDLNGIAAIGVDEVQYRTGHKYLTLVYQIDAGCRRLLWITETRTVKAFKGFFTWLGTARSKALRVMCSDMWKPYLNVIHRHAGRPSTSSTSSISSSTSTRQSTRRVVKTDDDEILCMEQELAHPREHAASARSLFQHDWVCPSWARRRHVPIRRAVRAARGTVVRLPHQGFLL